MQLFVFESGKRDLHTSFAQQRLPLFEAITLAGRSVVKSRHQGENTHNYSENSVYRIYISCHEKAHQTQNVCPMCAIGPSVRWRSIQNSRPRSAPPTTRGPASFARPGVCSDSRSAPKGDRADR